MSVVFACSESTGFQTTGSPIEDTTVGHFRAAFSRGALIGTPAGHYIAVAPAPITDGWIRFGEWISFWDSDDNNVPVQIYADGSPTPFLRFWMSSNATTVRLEYWTGSAWAIVGGAGFDIDTVPIAGSNVNEWAFKITCGNPGTATLLINGVQKQTGPIGNLAAAPNFRTVRLSGADANAGESYSEVIMTDAPTSMIGSAVETEGPTSNGTDGTDGTGSYTDIDEAVTNDADLITFTAAGQRRSFKSPARTGTLAAVLGIGVAFRANRGSSGPQNFKFYLLIGGVRYYSPVQALILGFAGYQYVWPVNPVNGFAWTPAEANDANLEWGVEAVA